VCITTIKPDATSNHCRNRNSTSKTACNSKHSTEYSHMCYVSREMYTSQWYFVPFVLLSVVIVTLPFITCFKYVSWSEELCSLVSHAGTLPRPVACDTLPEIDANPMSSYGQRTGARFDELDSPVCKIRRMRRICPPSKAERYSALTLLRSLDPWPG